MRPTAHDWRLCTWAQRSGGIRTCWLKKLVLAAKSQPGTLVDGEDFRFERIVPGDVFSPDYFHAVADEEDVPVVTSEVGADIDNGEWFDFETGLFFKFALYRRNGRLSGFDETTGEAPRPYARRDCTLDEQYLTLLFANTDDRGNRVFVEDSSAVTADLSQSTVDVFVTQAYTATVRAVLEITRSVLEFFFKIQSISRYGAGDAIHPPMQQVKDMTGSVESQRVLCEPMEPSPVQSN